MEEEEVLVLNDTKSQSVQALGTNKWDEEDKKLQNVSRFYSVLLTNIRLIV
jgi:hypothetical protein